MFAIETVNQEITLLRFSTARTRAVGLCTYVPLIDGILFDSSFPHSRSDLLPALQGKRVEKIANTHSHEDHMGNNEFLARELGIPSFAPEKSLTIARSRQKIPAYRKFFWGTADPCQPIALEKKISSSKFTFDIIATPGHVDDMVAFFEPKMGWAIGGDLFLGVRARISAPWENGHHWISSLKQILERKPKIFLCYHKGALRDPILQLKTKLEFLEKTRDQVLTLAAQGKTPRAIARKVLGLWPEFPSFVSCGEFSKVNLVRSFLLPE